MTRLRIGHAAVWAAVLLAAAFASAAPFEGLGTLEAGYGTEATAVSADGSVIVGTAGSSSGAQAFRWTEAGGIAPIPRPAGLAWNWAADVSADGSVVVGWASSSVATPVGTEGYRWNVSGALDRIAQAGTGVFVKGVSGDGSIVVGSVADEAFAWTAGGGIQGLGGLSAPPFRSGANAISADGQVIVGDSLDVTAGVRDAFRLPAGGSMQNLGAFTATAVSRDGSVIVGYYDGPDGREAFRWTLAGGLEPLGSYAADQDTFALGVSGNGSIVVGYMENQLNDVQSAWVWDRAGGMRLLADVLVDEFAMDAVNDWVLTRAVAVSDDGKTVVGRGYNPDGVTEFWRAQSLTAPIPEPTSMLLLALAAPLALRRRRKARTRA